MDNSKEYLEGIQAVRNSDIINSTKFLITTNKDIHYIDIDYKISFSRKNPNAFIYKNNLINEIKKLNIDTSFYFSM